MTTKKHYKLNVKRFRNFILYLTVLIMFSTLIVDCYRFPEKYSTMCRYQLESDIKSGDPEAISYYNDKYVANNINLFEK